MTVINTLADLCDMLCVDEKDATASTLSHYIYKSTDCGASISVQCMVAGKPVWFHNGDDDKLTGRQLVGWRICTIVEGSDAEVNGPFMPVGTTTEQVDEWIKDMESQASELWDEANLGDDDEDEDEDEDEELRPHGETLQDRYSVYCQHTDDNPKLTFDQWLNN